MALNMLLDGTDLRHPRGVAGHVSVLLDMDEAEVLGAPEDDDGLDFGRRPVEDDATDARTLAAEI